MTDCMEEILESMLSRYRRGRLLALLFDYDGTLVPLSPLIPDWPR